MFLRLVAEIGVRLSWIARDLEESGATGIREAIDGLVKRDLMFLRAATKALGLDATNHDGEIAMIAPNEAPGTLADLAEAAPLAGQSYAMHRFSSALIHPGAGMRGLLAMVPDMQIGLRDSMVTCATLSADLLAELDPKAKALDPDELLAQPLFGFSATAVAHRLRRHLRKVSGTGPRA
jgi:hypothetical protein